MFVESDFKARIEHRGGAGTGGSSRSNAPHQAHELPKLADDEEVAVRHEVSALERQALLYHLLGEEELRDAYADSLRLSSQAVLDAVAATPGPVQTGVIARAHAKLGLAYALLGESISAVAEGSTAVSSLSIRDDAYAGADHLRDLILIYTLIGATDLAVQELQTALSVPSPLTRVELMLDPIFEPLRGHPVFPELLASVQ